MRRAFRKSLSATRVVLENLPPARRASENAIAALVDRVRDSVRTLGNLDGLNLPQVLDENHQGQPFLRNLDPRDFAERLGDDLGVDPIVNNVVAHAPSRDAFRHWVKESLEDGMRSFVLVGGTSSRVRYPGPTVLEANQILRTAAKGHPDVALGNITIPDRENEVDRLVEKTQAGCDFFTTQVLFDAQPMATVLRAYGKRCAAPGPKPASFPPGATRNLHPRPMFKYDTGFLAARPWRSSPRCRGGIGDGKDGPRRMDREVPEVRPHPGILSPRFAGGRPSDRPPPGRRRRGVPGGRGPGILGAAHPRAGPSRRAARQAPLHDGRPRRRRINQRGPARCPRRVEA